MADGTKCLWNLYAWVRNSLKTLKHVIKYSFNIMRSVNRPNTYLTCRWVFSVFIRLNVFLTSVISRRFTRHDKHFEHAAIQYKADSRNLDIARCCCYMGTYPYGYVNWQPVSNVIHVSETFTQQNRVNVKWKSYLFTQFPSEQSHKTLKVGQLNKSCISKETSQLIADSEIKICT